MIKLDDVMVDYVECYLDEYSREVYSIDAYYKGFSLTISGIIFDDDDLVLRDDLFDDMGVKMDIYKQFKDGDLEVVIHSK